MSNEPIVAFIAILLLHCGPIAVLWAISLIVIFAVNLVLAGWLRPHIGKEGFKRLGPSFAYRNASVCVSLSNGTIGSAPLFHCPPGPILWHMALAVFRGSRDYFLALPASATAAVSGCQTVNTHGKRGPAIALAHPSPPTGFARRLAKNKEASKPFSSKMKWLHDANIAPITGVGKPSQDESWTMTMRLRPSGIS